MEPMMASGRGEAPSTAPRRELALELRALRRSTRRFIVRRACRRLLAALRRRLRMLFGRSSSGD
jgi:hypothetical protein